MGRQTFNDRLMEAVRNDQLWFSDGRDRVINRAQRMLGEEPMLIGYGVPSDSWNNKAKTYKGLQRRTSLPGSIQELTDLQARDNTEWARRAVEDDGVVDPTHVRDHAKVRRTGSSCTCPPRGGATKSQPVLTTAVRRSQAIDLALMNAHEDAEARAMADALVDAI